MKHIVIFGAGGHGKVVRDIIEQQHAFDLDASIVAVYDDFVLEKMIDGTLPILNSVENLEAFTRNNGPVVGVIGIGNNRRREDVSQRFPLQYYKAIHPTAILAEDVKIGEGTVVMAGAIINSGARIGKHCIINTGAIIEHDCVIGDYAHISPGAKLAGEVTVGRLAHVGIGASVIQRISIGEESIVGAGAAVVRNVEPGATVVGVPARPIRCKEETQ